MRIGIDGRYIQEHYPGIGRYTFNLARALVRLGGADEFLLLHHPGERRRRHPLEGLKGLPGVELVEVPAAPASPAEQWALPLLARKLKLDLFHAPYPIRPYLLPCPVVVTIHDLIPERYPHYFPWGKRLAFAWGLRLSAGSARRLIAVSQATREELLHFLQVSPEKVRVVYEAADPSFYPRPEEEVRGALGPWGLEPGYILYLGMNKPHKNLVRLVSAYARLDAECPRVLAGQEDPRYGEAREEARRLGLGKGVRFLGDVPEEFLPYLYSGAAVFVLPSLWEGFGLPALEAMACGVPVAYSRIPALREVVGEAALAFDPLDVEAMAEALRKVLSDSALRERLREASLARAGAFSWEKAAQETLAVFREAAG